MRVATRLLLMLAAVAFMAALGSVPGAHAAVTSYFATLDGPSESPPNASPGTGFAQVDVDPVAHTMRVQVSFSGLTGTTTASHIHAPTVVAGTGTANVATQTPTFTGFPLGVTSGTYDHTFDTTQAATFNASYDGGTPASQEPALFQAMADGKAYLNVHSQTFTGGEIRGFLTLPTPTTPSSWGRIKSLYR